MANSISWPLPLNGEAYQEVKAKGFKVLLSKEADKLFCNHPCDLHPLEVFANMAE